MIGPGYGTELNNGRVLTALHVAIRMDFPIVYADMDKDIAIIETFHKNKYNLRFTNFPGDFMFTETVPQPGESGKPYISAGKIQGVIIGESGEFGIAAALDDSIIRLMNGK
jgi:hypothetical protein